MRRIRRECYRSYRQQSNLKKKRVTVARKDLNTTSVSGTEAFIIWMFIIIIVGFFIFAFTI